MQISETSWRFSQWNVSLDLIAKDKIAPIESARCCYIIYIYENKLQNCLIMAENAFKYEIFYVRAR